jgi:hypothetical protein
MFAMPQTPARNEFLPAVEIYALAPEIEDDDEQADGGIGIRHVAFPLVVHIARPDNCSVGTLFELFWGESPWPVASNFIREGDEGLIRIPFTVSVDHILEEWANPVFVRVTGEDGTERQTLPLKLRVNLRRPEGRDPDIDKPGHQNLVYQLPPDVLIYGVDDERALQGVEVIFRHWVNMAAYDLLICSWGSEQISHRVKPGEVGRDIRLVIDAATIITAGNGEIIPVGFQVIGPTGNYPDEWAPFSEITWVRVELDGQNPEAPYVLFPQIEHDIDSTQLGGLPVKLGVFISGGMLPAYNRVTLFWQGTDHEGVPVPAILSQELYQAGEHEFEIDAALVIAVAQGRVVAHYVLQGDEVPDIISKKCYLSVSGELPDWPPPTIDQQIGDYLDPNLDEAMVRFPSRASWPADAQVDVVWVTTGSSSTVEYRFDFKHPEPSGDMVFTLSADELKRFDGYLVEVYYEVKLPGFEPQDSPRRTVQVGNAAAELPAPTIELAPDGVLNLDEVTDYLDVEAPVTETEWAAHTSVKVQVVVSGAPTTHPILRDFVEANLGERVKVFYTLERVGQKPLYSHVTSVKIVQG